MPRKTVEFAEVMAPELATLAPVPPDSDLWIHEIKLDGYRLLARRDHERVDFYTRNSHRWSDKFPAIASEILRLPAKRIWLDGELVVLTEAGRSCFGSLQHAVARKDQACLAYWAFDLMFLETDFSEVPLLRRKHTLKELIGEGGWNLRYLDYQRGYGPEFFEVACQHELEGIVSKRADSVYQPGVRSRDWLKSKCRGYSAIRKVAWRWWERGGGDK